MPRTSLTAIEYGRLGGMIRARRLSAKWQSEIGRQAANARWARYRERLRHAVGGDENLRDAIVKGLYAKTARTTDRVEKTRLENEALKFDRLDICGIRINASELLHKALELESNPFKQAGIQKALDNLAPNWNEASDRARSWGKRHGFTAA